MAQKIRFTIHKICLISSLLSITLGCDQATKQLVRDSLPITGSLSYLHDSIRFEYARNPGAFLNFGAGLSGAARFWIFNVAVAIFLAGLAFLLVSRNHPRTKTLIALTLVLSGGIGNLIDRFAFGSVTDFLILGIGPFKTGIFNFADFSIMLGIALLVINPRRIPAGC